MRKLTAKQEKYCQEYVKTGNKSEAYRLAYNAENMKTETINRKAVALFENGNIRATVENLQKEASERNNIDIDWCIQQLRIIVEDNGKDRVQALDKLMKHLGGYEQNNEQKKPITNVVITRIIKN